MSGRGSGYQEVLQIPDYGDDAPPTPLEEYAATNRFSTVSAVSALSSPPTPGNSGYFPSNANERRYSDISIGSYVPTPPSRPVSQFESIPYSHGSLDEVDISHVRLTDGQSPAFVPTYYPPTSSHQSPVSAPARIEMPIRWPSLASMSSSGSEGITPPTPPVATASRNGSRKSQRWRSTRDRGLRRQMSYQQAIPEENDDGIELLHQAAQYPSHYDQNTRYEPHNQEPMVDLTSLLSPLAPKDEATFKEFNSKEANGQLTGGLGREAQPERLTTGDLMAGSPTVLESPINRMLTRRGTRLGTRLGRQATMRRLAQQEANKRGQVIEVLEENPFEPGKENVSIDISSYDVEGGDFDPHPLRRSEPLRKIYYPVANWKPHTMRWPYLTFLIAVSAVLGFAQEYLYLKQREDGLVKFRDPKEITMWDYFCVKYLGNILAVAYGVLWQLTDLEVTRLEPYYQLGKPGGALAAESINVDYTTVFALFRPFVALRYKHWAVAISSISALFSVIVIPTLQSASIELTPKRRDRIHLDDFIEKTIEIENLWSRALTGSLALVTVLGIILLILLQRRHSGLTADVKGIAGVAAMATKSHILTDFKDCDTVSPAQLHDRLKNHRYTLRNSSLAPDDKQELSSTDKEKYDNTVARMSANPHPFMMRLWPCISMIIILVLFTAFIPVLLFTPANMVTEHAPWLSTALAVILKFALQTLEQDVRMMEPFWHLQKRHAPPKTLTLDYVGMAFIEMPIRALWNGHLLLAALGVGSVLSEGLTVCVSSLGAVSGSNFINGDEDSVDGQETPVSFWASLVIGQIIMLYLIFTVVLVAMYRRTPFLPRQPSTIASVLGFVHQSKMLWDFVAAPDEDHREIGDTGGAGGTIEETNERMVKRFEKKGMKFGYGWYIGRDGEKHVGVDYEELVKDYEWGESKDWRKAAINTVVDFSVYDPIN